MNGTNEAFACVTIDTRSGIQDLSPACGFWSNELNGRPICVVAANGQCNHVF